MLLLKLFMEIKELNRGDVANSCRLRRSLWFAPLGVYLIAQHGVESTQRIKSQRGNRLLVYSMCEITLCMCTS